MPTSEGEVRWLDLGLAEILCHRIAEGLSDDRNEPMPAFRSADRGRLESSLHAPQQAFEDFAFRGVSDASLGSRPPYVPGWVVSGEGKGVPEFAPEVRPDGMPVRAP